MNKQISAFWPGRRIMQEYIFMVGYLEGRFYPTDNSGPLMSAVYRRITGHEAN